MNFKENLSKKTKKELLDILLELLNKNIITENQIKEITQSGNMFEEKPECRELFDYYNSLEVKNSRIFTESLQKEIINKLKIYSITEIKTFINRYVKVVNDKNYFFNYKWDLPTFLKRKEGISAFTDDGEKWLNYISKRPIINTDIYFERIWGYYPSKDGKEFAREEFDKKFIGKDYEGGRQLANSIYLKMEQYIQNTDNDFIMRFDKWLKGNIENGNIQ